MTQVELTLYTLGLGKEGRHCQLTMARKWNFSIPEAKRQRANFHLKGIKININYNWSCQIDILKKRTLYKDLEN